MIPASDLLTVRLLEAAVILLIFLGSQQLIVAAALDLALQGIGVGMTETTNIFFFFFTPRPGLPSVFTVAACISCCLGTPK